MEQIKKFQILALTLTVCLAASLFFNVYLLLNTSHTTAKTFVYEWFYAGQVGGFLPIQMILNGTLHLEITFKWAENYLSIIAKINDDDRHDFDMLGLVFDKNGNGVIDWGQGDEPYMLYASNCTHYSCTYLGYRGEGIIRCYSLEIPPPSSYHTCVFAEEGYTFDIKIPKSHFSKVAADMVYVYYQDWNIQLQPGWWVAVTFEGWR